MKKFFVVLFGISFLFLTWCSLLSQDTNFQNKNMMVGNDRDEYGCIWSAGYSRCESLWECVQPWETECESLMSSEEEESVVEENVNKTGNEVVEEQNKKNITEDWNVMSEWYDVDLETENIDKIYVVLEAVKDDWEADWGDVIPVSFDWRTENSKFNVDGFGILVENTQDVELVDIEKYFLNAGWSANLLNMADGTEWSLEWFDKDEMGCLIFWKMSDGVDLENDDIWANDLSVKCGIIDTQE